MSRAQRIAQNPKFNGYNDYSRANNTALAVLTGYLQGQALYGGLTFQQQVSWVDDADIVVISVGSLDDPTSRNNQAIPITAPDINAYQGSDMLYMAQNVLTLAQYAASAGKRVVVCGVPYFDIARASQAGGKFSGNFEQAQGYAARLIGNNPGLRMGAAVASWGYPGKIMFVPTYGVPSTPNQPVADSSSNYDGWRPSLSYSHAVSDFLAQWIVTNYGL